MLNVAKIFVEEVRELILGIGSGEWIDAYRR